MTLHPTYSPSLACESLECPTRAHVLAFCEKERCAYAWQRQAAEDRARRNDPVAVVKRLVEIFPDLPKAISTLSRGRK